MHRNSILRTVSLGLLTIVVAMMFAFYFTNSLPSSYAIGCDSYGYLKQKQLFTSQGLIGGLHTAETSPEANFLTSIASKINANPLTWSEMIAPHCHHFDKATHQIVLQYPPGTGFALSLLPEGKELQTVSAFMVVSLVLLYCLANILALDLKYFLLSTFVSYIVLAIAVRFEVASYSIPVTVALIPWIAVLIFLLKPEATARNIGIAIVLGALCGLLVDVRIASLLVLPGVACLIAAKAAFDQRRRQLRTWIVPAIWLVFFGLATIPLLYANHVNVGGIFNSTYAVYDRELRFNNISLIANNINYYFTGNIAGIVAVLTLAFLSLRLFNHGGQLTRSQRANLTILLLTFLGNLIFFCLKPVAIDYYFLPVSLFCLCFGLLDYSNSIPAKAGAQLSRFRIFFLMASLVLLGGGFVVLIGSETPKKVVVRVPDQILNPQDIVYAGITGGTINYYAGKYTSKLDFGTHCMAEQLLTRVALAGRKQYVVNDTPKMDALIHGIGVDQFRKIGVFEDLASRYDVYEFDPGHAASTPLIPCDLTVDHQLASQIALKLSGQVAGDTFKGVVRLTNHSDTSFSTRPVAGPVKLSWRFVDTKDLTRPPPWDARKDLTMMIASKHAYEIPFSAALPKVKGEYLLEVTLVQEGFSWFNEYGLTVPTQTVIVE